MLNANVARAIRAGEDTSANYVERVLCAIESVIRYACVHSDNTKHETMLNKAEVAFVRKALKAQGFKVSITAVRPMGFLSAGGGKWTNPVRGRYSRRDMIVKISW